jgi:hypothetical protein
MQPSQVPTGQAARQATQQARAQGSACKRLEIIHNMFSRCTGIEVSERRKFGEFTNV